MFTTTIVLDSDDQAELYAAIAELMRNKAINVTSVYPISVKEKRTQNAEQLKGQSKWAYSQFKPGQSLRAVDLVEPFLQAYPHIARNRATINLCQILSRVASSGHIIKNGPTYTRPLQD